MHSIQPRLRAPLVAVALCFCVLSTTFAQDTTSQAIAADTKPTPTLSAQEVVKIQLEALRQNDAEDQGIAVAFRFASPNNRRNTGPVQRFARMIRAGSYALMLRFTHASYESTQVSGRRAIQQVTLFAPGAEAMTYVFYLSRQNEPGPLHDCWMTDGVHILPTTGTPA